MVCTWDERLVARSVGRLVSSLKDVDLVALLAVLLVDIHILGFYLLLCLWFLLCMLLLLLPRPLLCHCSLA